MATYEFACDDCKNVFDVYQPADQEEEHTAHCPTCGKPARRVFTPTFFKFDFWYGQDDGLGAYCDTKKDRERVMREKNLERITD